MRPIAPALACLSLLSACGSPAPPPPPAPQPTATAAAPAPAPVTCNPGKQTVGFVTEDGVTLAADLHVPAKGAKGAPAVVLLHMIPPHHDRSNYPASFIDALVAEGFAVLNVDRRGAGESKGDPKEAYEGPKGRLDALAAVSTLTGACEVDPKRIGLVGASNGTTTSIDYAIWAHETPDAVKPAAIALLTGGKYTEKQHRLEGHGEALSMPLLFVYSPEEKAWSEAQKAFSRPGWTFSIYGGGDHGTKMFAKVPQAESDVVRFLVDKVGSPAPPGPALPAMDAWCRSTCERNAKSCKEIDVVGCAKNCTEAFGAVTGFCPQRLSKFVACVDRDELRCKAGAKIRTKGCDAESTAMTFCLSTFAIPADKRCKGAHCEEYGQCELIDGVCTATPASCAKVDACKAKGCDVANNMCEPK